MLGRTHNHKWRRILKHSPVFRPSVGQLAFGLIIPTLNEVNNIEPLLARLRTTLDDICWEAIFVDDGSTDGTVERVMSLAAFDRSIRLIQRIDRKGLSTAVVEGFLSTAAPFVGVIDADLQHDETILPDLIAAVVNGEADIAIGSRYAEGGGTSDWAESRLRASKMATWLGNLVIRTPTTDPMSGFFVTRRDLVVEIYPRLSGIGFKILMDLLASSKRQLRVKEVPYSFRSRLSGESKMGSAVAIEYLVLLIDKFLGWLLPTRLILFLIVGGLGVGVHLSILALGLSFAAGFSLAQSIAVGGAMIFNFTLNNLLTYRDRQLKGRKFLIGLASFAAISSVGAIANVSVGTYVFDHNQTWWLAGIAGAAMSALWNYTASSFLTWRKT
jgi:dolichol-phosphate mannosyltransferase